MKRIASFLCALIVLITGSGGALVAAVDTEVERTTIERSELDKTIAQRAAIEKISIGTQAAGISSADRPDSFDLKAYTTSVKSQGLFGTCWAFAAIAAAETTILHQLGLTNQQYIDLYGHELDFSEKSLAYFSRTNIGENSPVSSVFGTQTGEGYYVPIQDDNRNAALQTGGTLDLASSVLSSGTGLIFESDEPYRGKNEIIAYRYQDAEQNYYKTTDEDGEKVSYTDNTGDNQEIIALGYTPVAVCYDADHDDWSVAQEKRFMAEVSVLETYKLESPVLTDELGLFYRGYNEEAVNAIKDQLLAGRAVVTTFCSDTATESDLSDPAVYINLKNYAHYTYEIQLANHAVTIIGYDDHYSRENFLDHTDDPDGDGKAHLPEGDGAFLVKNSWGSVNSEFPNYLEWGENGSGYFWLSYYDRSITDCEAYLFNISQLTTGKNVYLTDQYDMMPSDEYTTIKFDNDSDQDSAPVENANSTDQDSAPIDNEKKTALAGANVFCAESNRILDRISYTSATANSDVEFKVFLLHDDYTSPEDGELVFTKKAHYDSAGFHTVELMNQSVWLEKGCYYSIVISETQTEDQVAVLTVGASTAQELAEFYAESSDEEEVGHAASVINPGESWICYEGQWIDWASEQAEELRIVGIDQYYVPAMGLNLVDIVNSFVQYVFFDNQNQEQVKALTVDNLPIKSFSLDAEGTIGNLTYRVDADGTLTIDGSGDLSEMVESAGNGSSPLTLYGAFINHVRISQKITGIFNEEGILSPAVSNLITTITIAYDSEKPEVFENVFI